MAFAIQQWGKHHIDFDAATPAGHFEFADQAGNLGNTAPQNVGFGVRTFTARIYQKGWSSGTGTVGPLYELEVADNNSFTSTPRRVAAFQGRRTVEDHGFMLGVNLASMAQWVRIKVTLTGTDAATFDAVIDAI